MSLSLFWIGTLEVAAAATSLAVLWLAHSTIVISVGLLAGRLLRGRGPALQSAIYRIALAGTLACPAVAAVWAHAGLSFAPFRLPGIDALRAVQRPANAVAAGRVGGTAAGLESFASQKPAEAPRGVTSKGLLKLSAPSTGDESLEWSISPGRAIMIVAVSLSWLLGSTLLLSHLIAAHWQMVTLRRAAVSAADDDQRLCKELSGRIGVAPPALLRTPLIAGPCLAGIVRPTILLPEVLSVTVPRSVLIHELAHLRRGDCVWNFLSKATVAVLFFQPLVWRLSRLLETTAEEVCDDFVVEYGADRRTYADLLVELAKSSLIPASGAVVPLIAFRSRLAQRVVRIMDRTRRLQLTVSTTTSCAILSLGLATTLAATALGPADRRDSASDGHQSAAVIADLNAAGPRPQDLDGEASSSGPAVETIAAGDKDAEVAPGGDYKVGDRVVVIHQSAPIVQGDKTVDRAYMGWIYTIDKIEGSRLWVPAKTPGWIEKQDTVRYVSALAYFNDYLERNPTDKQARRARAMVLMSDGGVDAAISDFTEMLRLDPKDHTVWNDLGRAWAIKGDYDRAIANFNEAIRIRAFVSVYFHNRGEAWYRMGDAVNAIKDWKTALTVRPKYYWPQRQLAWLLATWPDERLRSGTEALKRATVACELSDWQDVAGLETLAAAYAESGDFGQAIQWQTKANELNPHKGDRPATADPLDLYKQGKPYRDNGTSDQFQDAP
jgi:beta-lactamase regulating signal transducer with metallopeptidase domain